MSKIKRWILQNRHLDVTHLNLPSPQLKLFVPYCLSVGPQSAICLSLQNGFSAPGLTTLDYYLSSKLLFFIIDSIQLHKKQVSYVQAKG